MLYGHHPYNPGQHLPENVTLIVEKSESNASNRSYLNYEQPQPDILPSFFFFISYNNS